ncbi:hypothetical protein OAG1_04200 [Agarivorans sp. OAG1]|jgi:hypothetical protein|uniref:Uncharacterized protein n=1 Tax=Agarivorans albus MKT 106 TaxID=1331007 RepID=R9PM14_AGAAL|nr:MULTISPECIES: hypothetical protein [Agarivorans]MPW31579.1 hypothetical protein [Agarivorans sp. B2Z047]UQN42622.1 hypothetical protein LQZ07_23050 [Agarivorans sp. B2Z047]BEU01620.1 hypothetical protein OAG1_04200 [Agarivorans sp. OAG1]GAD02345.1 hypothetical protein AALB_2425 [Agarivorans albus MKT 106]
MKSPLQISIVVVLVLIVVVTYKLKSVGESNLHPYISSHFSKSEPENLAQPLRLTQTERIN